MVVDDEMLIRKGITSFINASGEDFQVAESFADGDQAISYLKDHDVDLIISDIRMTRVSGIELAQYVAENKPHIRVILLSGYREFEYARSAIQYGVKNYLLKPTDFAQFREVLSSMKKELDESAQHRETVLFMDRIKALYAWILSGRKKDAAEAMLTIFKDAQNCPLPRMRQYIYDVFEILLDKFNLYLRIKVEGEKLHLEQLIMQESEEKLRACALEILDRVYVFPVGILVVCPA